MARQSLSTGINLKHGIKLSPQQIQLMKLLQIPTATLDQRVQEELEANPALEQGDEGDELNEGLSEMELEAARFGENDKKDSDEAKTDENQEQESDYLDEEVVSINETDFELDDYLMNYIEDDPMSYKMAGDRYNSDEENRTIPIAVENTFHEHLEEQLGLVKWESEKEAKIAIQIIGSIDDDGYLRRELIDMVNDLAFSQNVITDEKSILEVLKKIQTFDPPGIGCRNLQECLLIQLRKKLDKETMSYERRLVLQLCVRLIYEYFEEFTKKHYSKLQRYLEITEDDLRDAIEEILKLNPKPASGFATKGDRALNYIVPDFIINTNDGELELTLNARNAPDLRVSDQYRDMLKDFRKRKENGTRSSSKQKDAVTFIKDKIASAKWFIDAIRQRQQTMLRTMNSILAYQYDYFLTGDQKKIRPMILKDISEITGLDISTISRVANSKYVQTEFGTKRLKEFFSESIQTQKGEEVSTLEVKKILTEIIEMENKRKPLSDEKLRAHLQSSGYNIARRTVAKYREQMNIPVARLRKEL